MSTFAPENPDFESAVRDSFDRLTLMRTIGAAPSLKRSTTM